jgi:hypothetical protein
MTECWTYEVRDWCKQSFIRRKMRVLRASKFLTGRTQTWYMRLRVVVRDQKKWMLNQFFEELFNYCFPIDFRSMQRCKFQNFEQHRPPIKDYKTDLEVIADSIGDITPRGLIVQFWEGADYSIRHRWALDGFDAETASISELEAAAVNYEQAAKVAKSQKNDSRNKQSPSENGNDSNKKDRKNKQHPRGPRQEGRGKDTQQHDAKGKAQNNPGNGSKNNSGQKKDHKGGKPKNGGNKSHNLSKDQMNEYRAQGKCFTCVDTGHLSKDCPKRNELKPGK